MAADDVAKRSTSAGSVVEIMRIPDSLIAPVLVAREAISVSRCAWAISSAAAAAISSSISSAPRPVGASLPPWIDSTPINVSPASSGSAA
jgi:hypothetical protein